MGLLPSYLGILNLLIQKFFFFSRSTAYSHEDRREVPRDFESFGTRPWEDIFTRHLSRPFRQHDLFDFGIIFDVVLWTIYPNEESVHAG